MTPHQLSDLTLIAGLGLLGVVVGLGGLLTSANARNRELAGELWWARLRLRSAQHEPDFAATFALTEIDPDPLKSVRDGLEEE